MKNPKESGIKITRINSSNKIHFYPLMRTEAYLSVDEPFHYTIGAIKENAEDDDNRCLGTLQFATDKEKNQNSQAYILHIGLSDNCHQPVVLLALIRELVRICRTCHIDSIVYISEIGTPGITKMLRTGGFVFEDVEVLQCCIFFEEFADAINEKLKNVSVKEDAGIQIISPEKLSNEQANILIRRFREAADPRIHRLIYEFRDIEKVMGRIVLLSGVMAGAAFVEEKAESQGDTTILMPVFMRLFNNDPYVMLALAQDIIKCIENKYGRNVYLNIWTTFAPAAELVKYLFPEIKTGSIEKGVLYLKKSD